ncbi:MAG: hypothetical protein AB7O95_13790 [Geminicoccaceae bacterium]
MPRALHPDPDADALAEVRDAGAHQAQQLLAADAITGELERVAWAAGVGSVDGVRSEVERARTAGYTWSQIGMALGENGDTARIKYGQTGYAAQRRYRRKHQAERPAGE